MSLFEDVLDDGVKSEHIWALEVAHRAAKAAYDSARASRNWGIVENGHEGQHGGDVEADNAALAVFQGAGVEVLSEESGIWSAHSSLTAVIDPVDGSTNVSRGVPLWCSSVGLVEEGELVAGLVLAMPFGDLYWAVRGHGAFQNSSPLSVRPPRPLSQSIVFLNGYQPKHLGWSQYRALGSAALELCMVASGVGDAFIDCSGQGLALWDYMGALLVCQEAGCVVEDIEGKELVEISLDVRRHVLAASSKELFGELSAALR